ncbi:MAG: hypothetical protein ACRCUT_14795, partial [Spirochaetota bacterium]
KAVLVNIAGGSDLSLHEATEVTERITSQADPEVNVIFGTTIDPALDDRIRVTVIATGFDRKKNLLSAARANIEKDMTSAPAQNFRPARDMQPSFYQEYMSGDKKIPLSSQTVPSMEYGTAAIKSKRIFDEDLSVPACLRRGGNQIDSAF